MSMFQIPSILSTVDFTAPRLGWASALGSYTRQRREQLGLSLERAAELAGLALSEWYALESGWVPDPDDHGRIEAIAATLEIFWVDYSFLLLMASCQSRRPEESAGEA